MDLGTLMTLIVIASVLFITALIFMVKLFSRVPSNDSIVITEKEFEKLKLGQSKNDEVMLRYESQMKELKAELDKTRDDLAVSHQDLEEIKQQAQQAEANKSAESPILVANMKKELEERTSELVRLRMEFNEKQGEYERQARELEAIKKETAGKEDTSGAKDLEITRLTDQVEDLKKQIAAKESEMNAMSVQQAAAPAAETGSAEDAALLKTKLDKSEEDARSKDDDIKRLNEMLAAVRSDDSKKAESSTMLSELNQKQTIEINNLKEQITKKDDEIKRLNDELTSIGMKSKDQNRSTEEALKTVEEELARTKEEFGSLKKDYEKAAEELSSRVAELTAVKEEADSAKLEKDKGLKELDALMSEIDVLKKSAESSAQVFKEKDDEITKLSEEVHKLSEKASDKKPSPADAATLFASASLKKELEKSKEDMDKIESELIKKTDMLKSKDSELNRLKKEYDNLLSKIDALEKEAAEKKQGNEDMRGPIKAAAELKEYMNSSRAKFDSILEKIDSGINMVEEAAKRK